MTAKEIIEKLKATFSELTAPVKFMDASLADGTAIQVTDMVVGGIVTINGAPAPAGEYTLADGSVLVVGDNGAITEIYAAPAAPAPDAAAAPAPVAQADQQMGEKFAAFEAATSQKFADYEAKFTQYEQRLDKATKVIEGLLNLTQTLAETPTAAPDPAVRPSSTFAAEPKQKDYSILFS